MILIQTNVPFSPFKAEHGEAFYGIVVRDAENGRDFNDTPLIDVPGEYNVIANEEEDRKDEKNEIDPLRPL